MSLSFGGNKADAGRRPLQKFERGGNGQYSTSASQEEIGNGGEGDESFQGPHETHILNRIIVHGPFKAIW